MANPEDEGKTEQPTGRRIDKAHEEGQWAISQEIKTMLALVAITVIVSIVVPPLMGRMVRVLRPFIEQPHAIPVGAGDLQGLLVHLGIEIGLLLAAPIGVILVGVLIAAYFHTGLVLNPGAIKFDLTRLNPLPGFRRLISAHQLVELVKGLFKLVLVGTVATLIFLPIMPDLPQLPELALPGLLDYVQGKLLTLVASVTVLSLIIAGGDWWWQRHQFTKKLMMSKQEVKDEGKQSEGDPQIKAKIRQLRFQRAMNRMMASVPKADVVVTNPTHFAVALKYDMEAMGAPMCVAKGQDFVALRIREIAQDNDVPVLENPPLARALYASVEIDQEVPPEHYKAVAEVISYVFRLKGKIKQNK